MYQKINRNSRGQFMRKRERWFHMSAIPTPHKIKDENSVVTEKITWSKHTYAKVREKINE